jgi:hypothetical protein
VVDEDEDEDEDRRRGVVKVQVLGVALGAIQARLTGSGQAILRFPRIFRCIDGVSMSLSASQTPHRTSLMSLP